MRSMLRGPCLGPFLVLLGFLSGTPVCRNTREQTESRVWSLLLQAFLGLEGLQGNLWRASNDQGVQPGLKDSVPEANRITSGISGKEQDVSGPSQD